MNEYQILKSIGVGSYGSVYLALNKQQNIHYVVKKLKMWDIKQDERQKIDNEVKLLRQLQHINIVGYRDSFLDSQRFLNIVMTNCQGGDIYQLIQNSGGKKIEEKQIIDWAVQVALAIYYMHQKKILHRDLKTSNIFLNNNRVRLGDFGISKVLDQKNDFLAQTNIGTPLYMSPQQFKNRKYSYKSDIWAFGCVLYEMCNHKHAFTANSIQGLARKIFLGQYSQVSDYYSYGLRQMIHKMLSQNPKGRPSIVQILQKPFMKRRVQTYIKEIINQGTYNQSVVDTLISQARSLGIKLDVIVGGQNTPRKSSSQAKLAKKQSEEKFRRQKVRQQLQEKLRKENQDKVKMQEKIRQIQRQRKKMQQEAKSKRKTSYQRVTSALSGRNSVQSKKKDQSSTNAPSSASSRVTVKKSQISIVQPTISKKQESTPKFVEQKKPFQMQEEHDMNYEQQQSESDDDSFLVNEIIKEDDEQIQEEEEIKNNNVKFHTQPNIPIQEQSIKQEIAQSVSMVKADMKFQGNKEQIKLQEQPLQKIKNQERQPAKLKQVQAENEPSVNKPPLTQENTNQVRPVIDEARKKDLEDLRKQVKQKTAKINLLETELQAIDFQFSSDSEGKQDFKQKRENPSYLRVKQRVNDLKHKIIAKLGRDGYNKLMKTAHSSSGKENKPSRQEVAEIVGSHLIGLWHLAQQIVNLQKVNENIPQYF